MGLAWTLVVLLLQCRGILCLPLVNVLSLWCFYREPLLLPRSLSVGRMLVAFVQSSLCEWNQRPWQSRQIVMSPVGFLPYIYIYKNTIQSDSFVSDTNAFINFLNSVHCDTRRETQFLKVYANHTMLTPPQHAVHLVMFKISVGRDTKKPTTSFSSRNRTDVGLSPWCNG